MDMKENMKRKDHKSVTIDDKTRWSGSMPGRGNLVALLLIFLLIVPATALCGAKDRIKHLTSITRGGETGRLVFLGTAFFDENRDRLYVTDTTGKRILAFDADYKFVSQFNAGGALVAPTSLARNSKGQFFVAEPTKGVVLFIDIKERTVKPINFSDVPRADVIYPGNMALDSADNLYIVDKANQRILIFDAELRFDRQILVKEGKGLIDVKVGSNGNIYALNAIDGSVNIFDRQGKLLLRFGKKGKGKEEFNFPVSLAVQQDRMIYVVDQHKHNIMVFNRAGEFVLAFSQLGWREGRLYYPHYIYINKAGKIFVVDRGNSRISIFE